MKPHNEGPWLSPTAGAPALNALSALKTGLQPQPEASSQHSPPRTRRVQVSSIISVINQEGLETFEREQFREFHRSNSSSTFDMRFTPKSLINKLWPRHPKKKLIGGLKGSGKMLASGLLFGGGLEMAGAIARKSQNTKANNGAQYISLTNYGPAIAKFDSVDTTTNPVW